MAKITLVANFLRLNSLDCKYLSAKIWFCKKVWIVEYSAWGSDAGRWWSGLDGNSHFIKIEMIWLNYLFQKLGWLGFCCQVFCDWTRRVTWPLSRAVVGCWLADNVFLVVESKQCFARAQVQDIHFLRVWLTSSEYSATPHQHYATPGGKSSPQTCRNKISIFSYHTFTLFVSIT